jgi:hypothetical protein
MVFNKKKELKGNVDKTFITENLTRHRYDLLKKIIAKQNSCMFREN